MKLAMPRLGHSALTFAVTMAVVMSVGFGGVAFAQTAGRGTIAGCVSEEMGILPGVDLTLFGGSRQWKTTTDATGCYQFKDLPAGIYTLTANIVPWIPEKRENISVRDGAQARLDLVMTLSATAIREPPLLVTGAAATAQERPQRPISSINFAISGTAEAWQQADAVVHLRIERSRLLPHPYGGLRAEHTATVIQRLKTHSVGGPSEPSFSFVQFGSTNERPYARGEEFIAFLHWSTEASQFVRAFGPPSVYLVKNGKVTWLSLPSAADPKAPVGEETISVEAFVERLRARKQ